MLIASGKPAPDFELQDETGTKRHLSDYKGANIVLYFYPKDDTPGCTTEACSFRDSYKEYLKAGAVILGVSPDAVHSHEKFKEKYHLPFPLLADPDHKVCDLYGVWGLKKMAGREYYGVNRTTYLINPEGIIQKVFEKVKPAEHSPEVLEALCV